MIDRSSKLPVYAQVEEHIRRRIQSGEWPAGSAIPPERELARVLGVSRLTVRQAIQNLVQEGLVSRRQGAGTFVAAPTSHLLLRFGGFAEDMVRAGATVTTELLDYTTVPAGPADAGELGVAPGSLLIQVTRLRSIGGAPVLLGTSLIPWEVCPLTRDDCAGPSLYSAMARRCGRAPERARRVLGAVRAGGVHARYLRIQRGAPLLYVEGVAFDAAGTAMELFRNYFCADRIRFAIHTTGG